MTVDEPDDKEEGNYYGDKEEQKKHRIPFYLLYLGEAPAGYLETGNAAFKSGSKRP
jgi:hypothetical protein